MVKKITNANNKPEKYLKNTISLVFKELLYISVKKTKPKHKMYKGHENQFIKEI